MRPPPPIRLAVAAALGLAATSAHAASKQPADWTRPTTPFRIVGNVYYVGSRGLAAYLITSPAGDVLIDGTLAENAPLIERNLAALGVPLKQVKVLLNSHAHSDHAGGLAQLKQDTGALMMASAGDRWALEHGQARGDTSYGPMDFPPVQVDRVLQDGETIHLGGISLSAHLTPGHTPGCTTWTLPVRDRGRTLRVAIPCSVTVAGNLLVGNRAYPDIVADYRHTFARLRTMRADVTLTNHPELADVLGRHARQAAGRRDAFVDPGQLQRIVGAAQAAFETELTRQAQAGSGPGGNRDARGGG